MPARSRWIALISGFTFACGARTAPGIGGEAERGTGGGAGSGAASGNEAGAGAGSGGSGGVIFYVHPAKLAAGESHTCFFIRDRVKCWGNNLLGVLGLGDTEHRGDDPAEMGELLPALAMDGDRRP